jgi:S1-C subfamily serine protease
MQPNDAGGVVVTDIKTSSPAHVSGVHVGDLVLQVAGQPCVDRFSFFDALRQMSLLPGDRVPLLLHRPGKGRLHVSIQVAAEGLDLQQVIMLRQAAGLQVSEAGS